MDKSEKTRHELEAELQSLREQVKRLERTIRQLANEPVAGGSSSLVCLALDALSTHTAIVDDQGTIIAVNRAWREFAAANPPLASNVCEGANYLEVCDHAQGPSSDEAAAFAQAIRAALAGEISHFDMEYPCHSPDQKRWFIGQVFPIALEGSRYVVVAHETITKRKLAEEALRGSEALFRAVFEQGSLGMAMIDEGHRLLKVNPALCQMLGYTPVELMGLTIREITHPEDYEIDENVTKEMFAGGPSSFRMEKRFVRKDGDVVWGALTASVIRDETGQPLYGLGMVENITVRKRVEAEAKRRNQELAVLLRVSQELANTLDLKNIWQTVLQSTKSVVPAADAVSLWLYDEQRDTLVARAWDGYGENEMIQTAVNPESGLIGQIYRTGQPRIVPNTGEDDSFQPLMVVDRMPRAVMGVPLVAENRVIAALIAVSLSSYDAFSVDDMRLLQSFAGQAAVAIENARLFEENQYARSRLEVLSRRLVEVQEAERRHLARELHDEVGQLLTGLNLSLQMAERHPDDAANLQAAQDLASKLMTRVGDISLDLRPTMLDVLGLLPTLLWHFERYTAHTGVRVNFKQTGLERRYSPEIETAVYRIVQEALTNAARHANVEEVLVLGWMSSSTLGVQVYDEGIGFDLSHIDANSPTSGLTGMRERVVLLGGKFTIDTRPGQGTRLTAEFPIHADRSDQA